MTLTPEFTRQLHEWMKINGLVPIDSRDYALLEDAKKLFSVNGNAKRHEPRTMETPYGPIEV